MEAFAAERASKFFSLTLPSLSESGYIFHTLDASYKAPGAALL